MHIYNVLYIYGSLLIFQYLLIAGGITVGGSFGTHVDSVEMMEVGGSQWSLLDQKLPDTLYHPELVSVRGNIYLLGETLHEC